MQGGGAAPLVLRRVVQLLVLGRRRGEDGGHRQQHRGSVGVTQLVDHDGGQNQAEQLEGNTGGSLHQNSDQNEAVACCVSHKLNFILTELTELYS